MGSQPAEVLVNTNGDLLSDVASHLFIWRRRLFLVLGAIALIYAFLAGLRTISDPDSFWQLATGRWVAQHHHVFSTEVFSYTAQGQPWIYPVGSSLFLYWVYVIGGYALLSWVGALRLRRNDRLAAAPRFRCNRSHCHYCGDNHCRAHCAARRYVHGDPLRGVSFAYSGKTTRQVRPNCGYCRC